MTIFDYAFVGAGPASLSAAAEVSSLTGASVLILEAGAVRGQRGCVGMRASTCTACAGDGCHVTHGMGGSSAIFGNKMCYFPASEGIKSLIAPRDRAAVDKRVRDIVGVAAVEHTNLVPLSAPGYRKIYDADLVYRGDYRRLVLGLEEAAMERAHIVVDNRVLRARRVDECILIQTDTGDDFLARNLVIATGRAGSEVARGLFSSFDVAFTENQADIGIRLEADTIGFEQSFFYQNDPKYKFNMHGVGSSRTFCACRGGAIIPVKHGGGFFADGAFLNADTGRTNIALMTRSLEYVPETEVTDWMRTVNAAGRGSLLLAQLPLSMRSSELAGAILASIPEWPTEAHRTLMKDLLEKVVAGDYVTAFRKGSGNLKVYGPSIDLYWPQVTLSEGFATTAANVYAIGDATGVSRGILQAITSGIAWARAAARATAASHRSATA